MAGVKGRSGGARPNTGGARPGAGAKPKQPAAVPATTPMQFLLDVMHGLVDPTAMQLKAAMTAARIQAAKAAAPGKKAEREDAAKEAVKTGRYAPSAPPTRAPTH